MIGPLKPFNTIGREEAAAAEAAIRGGPLSGYLGGIRQGGYYVEKLESEFAAALKVRHAVACNSCTSGLLMACMAAGVGPGADVVTTPLTMSATAAVPALLGAGILFGDIEDQNFCLASFAGSSRHVKATIITNLFGHPATLKEARNLSAQVGWYLIEDNAQAPFAMEYGQYAGTIGHIGVFSFNVHKHLHCGEGGICVTNDDTLADDMRRSRNHGELFAGVSSCGLNLRMTEVTAAIALAQLAKREQIISERIEIAETLTDMVRGLPGLTVPTVREGCRHVFYIWALKVNQNKNRDSFVQTMQLYGMPLRAGYVDPLYRLPAFKKWARPCPVAERMHDQELVIYENCAWSPTSEQLKLMGEAVKQAVDMSPAMG